MPLTWDASRIEKFKDNTDAIWIEHDRGDGKEYECEPKLKALIFAGGVVGYSSIKYSNVAEWYARFKICEELYGISFLVQFTDDGLEYIKLTPSALKEYIGLGTNHSTYTRKEWIDNVLRQRDIAEYMTEAKLKSMIKKYMNEFDNS